MQMEGTKLIFVTNFCVLDFFKFDSRLPQIAQISVLTFKIFLVGRGRGVGGGHSPGPPEKCPPFFFISNSRL